MSPATSWRAGRSRRRTTSACASIGDELSAIWWRTSERSHPNASIPDQSAIVADIASSPQGVLELATGDPETIYVIVPGANGSFELARGGVYSYYEFTDPPGSRLTDEAWRARLETKPPPARPAWQAVFRVPCPHGGTRLQPVVRARIATLHTGAGPLSGAAGTPN